jgi:hypothetical protein
MKRFMNTHAFIGVTTTSFIESGDYSNDPVHSQLDYTFIDMLSPTFEPTYRSVKLHVNLAELNDDALALYDGESRAISTFFSTESTQLVTIRSPNKDAYFTVRFQLDDRINIYSRVVYTMLELIGDIGGIA